MSEVSSPVIQRIVPGAPPPAPVSKSQKRKKKPTAKDGDNLEVPDTPVSAQIAVAPSLEDGNNGSVGSQFLAQPDDIPEATTPINGAHKTTPLVDMLNKRIKATNKKIVRYLFHVWRILLTTYFPSI